MGVCKHIYLDMGTNIGIQIRKLYEPHYFKRSPIRWHFEDIFNSDIRTNICTIGFEPNSLHTSRLLGLQNAYLAANFPLVIFTNTAVGATNGTITFFHSPGQAKHYHESGASSIKYWGVDSTYNETALLFDVDKFIHKINDLWMKSASYHPKESRMVAKMDIEGSEYSVLPKMLGHGSLCIIHEIMIEWHDRFFPNATQEMLNLGKTLTWVSQNAVDCRLKLLEIDDNMYADGADNRPFPHPATNVNYLSKMHIIDIHNQRK
eukprot:gene18495-26097_t